MLFRSGTSIVFFFIQQTSVSIGERPILPLTNSILIRVFQKDENYQWFVKNGMPQMDSVKKQFSGFNINNANHFAMIYQFYGTESTYPEFFKWLKNNGQSTYIKFLITHPKYTFLQEETNEQLQRIFAYGLWYIHAPRGYSEYSENIFPMFTIWGWLLVTVGVLILYLRKKQMIFIVPICLGFVFFMNIMLLYNADAMEDERHFFLTQIQIHLLTFFAIALLLDNINFIPLKQWISKTIRLINKPI